MGWIKYIVPIGAFIVGIVLTRESKEFVMPKMIQFFVIILCICALMSSFQISSKELNINDTFSSLITEAYDMGEQNRGGGAIGALIAIPMTKTIGGASYVVLIGVAILLSIFTFGIKPAEIVDKVSEKIKESREYDEEEYEDEEEIEEKPKKKKEKKHSVIMEDLFDDEEPPKKQKYDHDIALAFEETTENDIRPDIKENAKSGNEEFIEANLFKETKEQKEEKTKQELQLEHSQVELDENYEFPPIVLLEQGEMKKAKSKTVITDNALKLQKTLHSFGVSAKVEDVAIRTCNYKI